MNKKLEQYKAERRAKFNQFVDDLIDNESEWEGGVLIDNGIHAGRSTTEIVAIMRDKKQGTFFRVIGKEFDCGVHTDYGSVDDARSSDRHIVINGYGSHVFEIVKKEE